MTREELRTVTWEEAAAFAVLLRRFFDHYGTDPVEEETDELVAMARLLCAPSPRFLN